MLCGKETFVQTDEELGSVSSHYLWKANQLS